MGSDMSRYTEEEKNKLVQRFKTQQIERRKALKSEADKLGEIFELKIRRRLQLVPKMFQTLKIKDVLTVERDHKIKIYQLISDIEKMKNQHLGTIEDDKLIAKEVSKLNQKKLENLKSYQKRKESIALSGKISKPTRKFTKS